MDTTFTTRERTLNLLTKDKSNNKGKSSKKDFLICAYCKKNGHEEHNCYKKEVDEIKNLFKKNQIGLSSRMTTPYPSSFSYYNKEKDHMGKVQALVVALS